MSLASASDVDVDVQSIRRGSRCVHAVVSNRMSCVVESLHLNMIARRSTSATFVPNAAHDSALLALVDAPPLPGQPPPPPPVVYDEYYRLFAAAAQTDALLESMEELAPLIDELQRLAWQREYAEVRLEAKERALLSARRALYERTHALLHTSVGARHVVRRLLMRASAAVIGAKRLVLPTDALKNNLDSFDVRDVPGREAAPNDNAKSTQVCARN